jgi:hypothetical protein
VLGSLGDALLHQGEVMTLRSDPLAPSSFRLVLPSPLPHRGVVLCWTLWIYAATQSARLSGSTLLRAVLNSLDLRDVLGTLDLRDAL